MIYTILKRMGWFVVLVLLQVLIFNHIYFFGYGTPLIYIYFILKMPIKVPRNVVMLMGFILGLTIDVFTNTLGLNATATVLLAFCQPYFLKMYAPRDVEEELVPERRQIGNWTFLKYVTWCVCVHHSSLLLLEYFTYVDILHILLRIIVCILLTVSLIWAVDKLVD